MGFDNDKRARKEMISYLKLHRLHSNNIVRIHTIMLGLHVFQNTFFLLYR